MFINLIYYNFSVLILLILANILHKAEPYSYMVPQMSCYNLLPSHNSSGQVDLSPYKIHVENKYYHPNDLVRGVIFFLYI